MKTTDAISVGPVDGAALRETERALRRGRVQVVEEGGASVMVPAALVEMLRGVVKKLGEGRTVVVLPEDRHLTTQQAGELLGVSRPYVIRLLDEGAMPYVLVGKHRRIALRDVMAYGRRRREALDGMAREAFEAGLYEDASAGMPEGGRDA